MFHIRFPPVRPDAALSLLASGHALTINGDTLHRTDLPKGAGLARAVVAGDGLASDIGAATARST